jgi:hypothetical protein
MNLRTQALGFKRISLVVTGFFFTCFHLHIISAQTATAPPQKANQESYPTQLNLETHMTPEEAKRILSAVDGLLNYSSEDSGLPIHTHVQGEMIDRKAVKEKREASLKKTDVAARMQRSLIILKKLGLVPRDFDARTFVLGIQDDPLAGFYDPTTKVFYMLDWIPAREQLPVMAHELTHALQDQFIGLETWMKEPVAGEESGLEQNGIDEPGIARRAAAEGQATAVMLDYILAPYGHKIEDLPAIDQASLQDMMRRNTRPSVLRAPRYIREDEAFPYSYGLAFVHEVLRKRGKEKAFAGMLKNPPQNSHQIMHPSTYLAGEKIPALNVPKLGFILGSEYRRIDSGVVGEFDALEFAQQFTTDEKARLISSKWRGGYYYLARRKLQSGGENPESPKNGASGGTPSPAAESGVNYDLGDVSLYYLSRWASPAFALRFAELYASSVMQRYSGAREKQNAPGASRHGEQIRIWDTSAGPVSIETSGPQVLVMESFDQATADRVRSAGLKRAD